MFVVDDDDVVKHISIPNLVMFKEYVEVLRERRETAVVDLSCQTKWKTNNISVVTMSMVSEEVRKLPSYSYIMVIVVIILLFYQLYNHLTK